MDSENVRDVVVVDIKMKFWSMVFFMVKWVIASIPAIIILVIIWTILLFAFQALTGGEVMWWHGKFFKHTMM